MAIIEELQKTIPQATAGFQNAATGAIEEFKKGLPEFNKELESLITGNKLGDIVPEDIKQALINEKNLEDLQNLAGMIPDLFKMLNNETVRALGQLPIPPAISAIDLNQVFGLLTAKALSIETEKWSTPATAAKVREPGVPVGGNATSSVWNARYNGSYIEMHSGGSTDDEFVNIQHSTGTRVTIDKNGSITIKAADGKVFIGSTGDIETSAEGHSVNAAQDGYTLEVTGGAINIKSAGDINFTTNGSINMNAATDIKMNCGANMDVSAKGRFALMAESDNIDIMAGANLKLGASRGNISVIAGKSVNTEAGSQINHNAVGPIVTYAGGFLGLRGSTVYVKGGGNIYLNDPNGDVSKPGAADPVYPAQIGVEPPEAKVVSAPEATGSYKETPVDGEDFGESDGKTDDAGTNTSTDIINTIDEEDTRTPTTGLEEEATPPEVTGPAAVFLDQDTQFDIDAASSKGQATNPGFGHTGEPISDAAIAGAAGFDVYDSVPGAPPDTYNVNGNAVKISTPTPTGTLNILEEGPQE